MDNNYGQYGGQIPNVPPNPPPYYYYTPDYVSPEEKKKIRRNYNSIGLVILFHYIMFKITGFGIGIFLALTDYQFTYDENGTMVLTVSDIIIDTWIPAFAGMLVFIGYCIFARYNPKELFSKERIRAGEIVKYVLLALAFQHIAVLCSMFIMSFLYSHGLEVAMFDFVMSHDPQTYAADIFSSVILAPIAEELIFRGVVLRCSAKVSGRFAIFFSAFMFGLMHRNPYQFVLGFMIGIVLAMITLKTGSIIPSIICHMAANLTASLIDIVSYFDENTSYVINILSIPVFIIIGIIVLVNMGLRGEIKFPPYTEHHKKRTLPIMITSWSVILVTVLFIIETVSGITPIPEYAEEALTAAAGIFLK